MSTRKTLRLLLLGIIFSIGLALDTTPPLAAQAPTPTPVPIRWSVPRRIPGFADDTNPPYLVADSNRTVHAFTSQWIGGDLAIFYSHWGANGSWSRPIDILLSPKARQATVIGAFLDNRGMMHVAFFGGTAEGAEIYYAQAPVANAGQASAWSRPQLVGPQAISPVTGMLTGDENGNLFLLYGGSLDGNGLYLVRSTDYGITWSQPETVFLTNSVSLWVSPVQGTLDAQGQLHIVWTVVNKSGNGEVVYYARLERDHQRWSRPFPLQATKGNDYEADWAFIIPYGNQLFVVYNYGFPPYRWMRQSSDYGRSWSDPTMVVTSLKGENGLPVLLLDSDNALHLVFANRTTDDKTVGIWHSEWLTDHWADPKPIISGLGSPQFNPDFPTAIISQGNSILVTWRTDPGLTPDGVWYSYATLDSPELPVQQVPTAIPTATVAAQATATSEPTLTPTREPTQVPVAQNTDTASPIPSLDSPTMTIGLTVASVLTLLVVVFVVRKIQSSFFH